MRNGEVSSQRKGKISVFSESRWGNLRKRVDRSSGIEIRREGIPRKEKMETSVLLFGSQNTERKGLRGGNKSRKNQKLARGQETSSSEEA